MTTRLSAALVVCLAASLPYLSSLNNYFVNDDFGVVQLLSRKSVFDFPRWFVTSWMDDIWGAVQDEIRPFTAITYQLAALQGATSTLANHLFNIAVHAASALLVLALGRSAAGLSLGASIFAALAFAVLPLHAESVAWITGRVDTIPTVFFLGSFLAYACWRRTEPTSMRLYWWSVVLFFCALFSKQNTIVMVAALFLYDALVERRPIRASWSRLAPYVPFAVLTIGYLALRYALFGEVAREGRLTADGLSVTRIFVGKHFQRMFFGAEVSRYPFGYIAALLLTAGVWLLLARGRIGASVRRGSALVLFFGPCWWILCLAPLMVVGYESTRHVYLAAAGWAIVLGLVFHTFWHAGRTAIRGVTLAAGAGLLTFYIVGLQSEVAAWNERARVSHHVVADLEREALSTPQGTLLIVGAPARSWEWSLPFAARRPFTATDLDERASIVWPILLDCCRDQWKERTQRTLRTWSGQQSAPVVVLRWDARTGARSKTTDSDDAALRGQVMALLDVETPEALDRSMLSILQRAR